MIDPISGFIIDTETLDLYNPGHEVLNTTTKVFKSFETEFTNDDNADLEVISDEGKTTVKGTKSVPKEKKRVWCKTDTQEWLQIYQEYMQKRLERRPKPITFKTYQKKNLKIGWSSARNIVKKNETDDVIYIDIIDSDEEETVQKKHFIKEGSLSPMESDGQTNIISNSESNNLEGCGNADDDYEDMEYFIDELPAAEDNTKLLQKDTAEDTIPKIESNELNLENSRYNSLKLVNYSNICLFYYKYHYFLCYCCLQRFRNMKNLRCHMQKRHSYDQVSSKMIGDIDKFYKADITNLECRWCRTSLNGLRELENHLLEHDIMLKSDGSSLVPYRLGVDTLTCQLCAVSYPNRCQLMKHMDGHFLNYVCEDCNMEFRDSRSLKSHAMSSHANDIGETEFSDLKQHKLNDLQMESDERLRFKCNQCPKKFRYDYKKMKHLMEVHRQETKLFKCELCPRFFMTVHGLTKHMNCLHQKELYS